MEFAHSVCALVLQNVCGVYTLGLLGFTALGLRALTPISGFGLQSRVIALLCVAFSRITIYFC